MLHLERVVAQEPERHCRSSIDDSMLSVQYKRRLVSEPVVDWIATATPGRGKSTPSLLLIFGVT